MTFPTGLIGAFGINSLSSEKMYKKSDVKKHLTTAVWKLKYAYSLIGIQTCITT